MLESISSTAKVASASVGASSQMCAARVHEPSGPFQLDTVPKPNVRSSDVLIEVRACGMVPNLQNVLGWQDFVAKTPELPAIFGLDPAGVVADKGSLVHGFEIGDRVYVNPLRYCGTCRSCQMGDPFGCDYGTLNGYFGMGKHSQQTFDDYPYGGYAEFMTAPAYSLVKIPDSVSFEMAARWGYLGTAYGALRKAKVDMSSVVLVNGASGTLGVGAVLFALALGAPKVLGVGRDAPLLEKVKAIDPNRVHVHSTKDGDISVADWARSITDGFGADVVLDALPTGSPVEAFSAAYEALGKSGRHVNCGGMFGEWPMHTAEFITMGHMMIGSHWFTTAQGEEMMRLADSGQLRLDIFEHHIYPLDEINTAMKDIKERKGGFSNFVVSPTATYSAANACPVYCEDIFSPEALREPFEHYRRIRDLGPVVRLEHPDVYVISRYADIKRAAQLPDIFVSTQGIGLNDITNAPRPLPPIIASAGERHRKLRQAMMKPLMPAALKEQRDILEAMISGFLDKVVDRGEVDAMKTIARQLPLEAISYLVGLPEEGRVNMLRWAAASFNSAGPINRDGTIDPDLQEDFEILREVGAYFQEFNPAHLRPGSWADLLFQAVKAGKLEEEEARSAMGSYVLPSLDTTIFAKGNLLYNLGRAPDQWALLRANPDLIRYAVNEAVRLAGIVRWSSRVAVKDYRIGDYVIPEDARVILLYASGNRDERQFPEPDRFKVDRKALDHIGFGAGPHMCAGMHLAKLELEVLLEAMVERVARIEVGSPVATENMGLYGFESLPITLFGA